MNRLKGNIKGLKTFDDLTLLEIEVEKTTLKSIIINDHGKKIFKVGSSVEALFKETELIISKNKTNHISLQNKMDCEIISIQTGELLSQIKLRFSCIELISIITTQSVKELNLKLGDQVTAMVKTNEIMVSKC